MTKNLHLLKDKEIIASGRDNMGRKWYSVVTEEAPGCFKVKRVYVAIGEVKNVD